MHLFGIVAQLVEQAAFNRSVESSSLSDPTFIGAAVWDRFWICNSESGDRYPGAPL